MIELLHLFKFKKHLLFLKRKDISSLKIKRYLSFVYKNNQPLNILDNGKTKISIKLV